MEIEAKVYAVADSKSLLEQIHQVLVKKTFQNY